MNNSQIFYTNQYQMLEQSITRFLNSLPEFMSLQTAGSTRAVGDAIQEILAENFQSILGAVCDEYSANFARRAMADLAFTDKQGLYYIVDVKTHRLDTKFNMPNLTSVERLARLYEDDNNYFCILMVEYTIDETRVRVNNVHFIPIEFLAWECLTIGALGWGQIQISNANNIIVDPGYSRKKWMIQLCDALLVFYPREIEKISQRMDHFHKVREKWVSKPD